MTVDEYIAKAPAAAQPKMQEMREAIRAAAPEAQELISYGIVGYKYLGRSLVYFGPAKKHIGLYGAGAAIYKKYKKELKKYDLAKGTIRFPLSEPLPISLIKQIVKDRLAENETRKGSGYSRKKAK